MDFPVPYLIFILFMIPARYLQHLDFSIFYFILRDSLFVTININYKQIYNRFQNNILKGIYVSE